MVDHEDRADEDLTGNESAESDKERDEQVN